MNMTTKKDIFVRYLNEYLKASKERKGEILDNICDVVQIHRKAAVRKFRHLQLKGNSLPEERGRKVFYTPDSIAALRTIWEAASEICGELLYPIISDYAKILQRDKMWEHSDAATKKLLLMSEATVKRRIIPIFTGPWADKPAGYGQVDTVVHCGSSLLGNMIFSVNYTDVATLWVSFNAQWNKGEKATKESLQRIKKKVPFVIQGIHSDTGSEFINYNLKTWCDEERIEMTRSRPSHKNDNAYVEQKNGHVLRRFLGYSRLDDPELVVVVNRLYDKLELYLNHFVPSRKCSAKVRIGSKYKKKYDPAKPAYRRVLEHPQIDPAVKAKLKREHDQFNPLILKREIDKMIDEIFKKQRDYRIANSEQKSN